jgi:hypothetical protein
MGKNHTPDLKMLLPHQQSGMVRLGEYVWLIFDASGAFTYKENSHVK